MEPTRDQKEQMTKALRSIGVSKSALEKTADEISKLVAPGESLWEYPGQLYRMVESRIENLQGTIHNQECSLDTYRAENEQLHEAVAAKDVSIAVLREACKEALWRLEQYNYQAMERTIERLRTALGVKQESGS